MIEVLEHLIYKQNGSRNGEGGRALDRKILSDYIDICELIRETEEEIQKLRQREIVHDKVSGSNPEFPYQKRGFHIAGINETYLDGAKLKRELELLEERKRDAERLKEKIDKWMKTIPIRMQRIIRMKYFEQKSWEEVAENIGRKATGESLRKEFERFLHKK